MKSAGHSTMPHESQNLISTDTLQIMLANLNGSRASSKTGSAGTRMPESSPFVSLADVALVVGGGGDPLSEYEAAKALCDSVQKSICNIVCNDMIALFPHAVDHAVTLHPDKLYGWIQLREKFGNPMPLRRVWAHRGGPGVTDSTRDWQGSSGLFMTKIALETGYTKIILCGVPMTVEAHHIVRHQPWNAAPGFMRGWDRRLAQVRPYARSMSGWTLEKLGEPTLEWLTTPAAPYAAAPERPGVTA
jgi:hypothetical protein